MMPSKVAFVTRATGGQGIAVTKALISAGYVVHAVVADPQDARSKEYQALSTSHIKLFTGSLDDTASLKVAITGCTVVFLNLMPDIVKQDREETQGKEVLNAAKTAGVSYVVYSTVLGLEEFAEKTMAKTPEFSTALLGKVRVEEALKESGFARWTILRPGYFMTNFLTPFNQFMWPGIGNGEAISSYEPTTMLNLTDAKDIAAFAVAAFANPEKFHGKIIPLASQKLPVEEALNQLRAVTGQDIKSVYRSAEESAELAKTNPIILGQLFLRDRLDVGVSPDELKSTWGVKLGTFTQFLEREKEWVDRTFSAAI